MTAVLLRAAEVLAVFGAQYQHWNWPLGGLPPNWFEGRCEPRAVQSLIQREVEIEVESREPETKTN